MLNTKLIIDQIRKKAAARSYASMRKREIDDKDSTAYWIYYKAFEAMERTGTTSKFDEIELQCYKNIKNIRDLL